ncbi:hypothetical protein Avbf_05869 [Armadillidium vulgare]|nr:hypothetical protein Avbf_05869 [Armadillidium vulgare]
MNKCIKAAARLEWDSAGQDVVVLHGFPRSKVCPNLSPYVLKLETYLRVAGIKLLSSLLNIIIQSDNLRLEDTRSINEDCSDPTAGEHRIVLILQLSINRAKKQAVRDYTHGKSR